MTYPRFIVTAARTTALWLVLCGSAVPADMPVPAKFQGAVFRRIFDYVKTFEKDDLQLLVVYSTEPPNETSDLMDSFEKAGLLPTTVEAEALAEFMGDAKAVYFLPGVSVSEVKAYCRENGSLSLSGIPSLVEQGDVSIGLTLENGKPVIIVNTVRLETEGHKLSSELLQLAKVFK